VRDIILTMKVSELGEFGLVDLLAKVAYEIQDRQAAPWRQLLVGIGDDAAAWHSDASIELATVDSLIQGTHFTLDTTTWKELGWKALAVGLSDIAAMGGIPKYALVSLGLPGHTEVDDVTDLYMEMMELGQAFGVAIVGGDTSSAPLVIINTTILGSTPGQAQKILTRSAARAGDRIAVTGYMGGAAAGLEVLTKKIKLNQQDNSSLRRAFLQPHPRVTEGQILVEQGVKAAIDISDGLISDLSHICQASKVGARIEVDLVPIHPAVKDNFGDKSLEMALSGGEDYELLFTASNKIIERVRKAVPCPITVIGEVVTDAPGRVTLVDRQGKPFKPARTGWQHFTTKK
jgi:thiamine-monophosphate kinase